jgi:hypothetical protein
MYITSSPSYPFLPPSLPLNNRSRSLTPPPTNHKQDRSEFYSSPMQPDTPPFDPISFKIQDNVSQSSAEHDKTEDKGKGTGQKRSVRFTTPTHSKSKAEPLSQVPMPISGPEREETMSNHSPSLVTGQSRTNLRTSLEIPASTNVFVLRSCSTESTDTDSDMYVTPRQSVSEVEIEKMKTNSSRAQKVMCKNCMALRRSSQEEIDTLKAKLKGQNKAMLDQITALEKMVDQKNLECSSLKDACDSAVVFVQELEAKVAKLKQLLQIKETQEAWVHYDVALDFLQRFLPQAHRTPVHEIQGGRRWQPDNWPEKREKEEVEAELSDSAEEENDSDEHHGDHTEYVESMFARKAAHNQMGINSSPIADRKQRKSSCNRSHKLLAMMKNITMSSSSFRRVASDSHPRKMYNARPPRTSLQHKSYYNRSETAEDRDHSIKMPRSSLQHEKHYHTSASFPRDLHKSCNYRSRHDTHPPVWKGREHSIPQRETGYWEEGEELDRDGGSFIPENPELHKDT